MLASKQLTSANFKKRDFLVSGRNNPTPNPVAKRRERPPCTPFAAEPCRASAAPEANRTLILVRGKGLSEHSETRCSHWHSPRDVLALAAPCCGGDFFACAQCHDEVTGHVLQPWPSDTPLATHALLCGKEDVKVIPYFFMNYWTTKLTWLSIQISVWLLLLLVDVIHRANLCTDANLVCTQVFAIPHLISGSIYP